MRAIEVDGEGVDAGEAGAVPMLQWVKIADLVVDDDYQRELKRESWTKIRKIAGRFRWSRFSTVLVSPVAGGKYAIVDGQHRTHAARLCDIEAVPCQIVQMTREEQAASFAAVNGMVTAVTGFQILRAAIVAGEPWAVKCATIVSDAGCALMTRNNTGDQKQAGEVYAIALIRKHAAAGNGATVTAGLKALRASPFGQSADAYANDVLKPLFIALGDRPPALTAGFDLDGLVARFDFYGALERAAEFVKSKRRLGQVGTSGVDIVAGELRTAIDAQLGGEAPVQAVQKAPSPGADAPPSPGRGEGKSVVPPPAAKKAASVPAVVPLARGALDGFARFRLKDGEGRYLNRYGTGWTDRASGAWEGTRSRADAIKAGKREHRNLVLEPAD